MSRAGGYAGYYAAIREDRLRNARPLHTLSTTQLPEGVHRVRVDTVYVTTGRLEIHFVDSRRRKHVESYILKDKKYRQLGLPTLRIGAMSPATTLKGREFVIELTTQGDAEILICSGGECIVRLAEGVTPLGNQTEWEFVGLAAAQKFLQTNKLSPMRMGIHAVRTPDSPSIGRGDQEAIRNT